MKSEATSTFSSPGIRLSSIWRELGILLLTISLFLLPWFRDLDPPAGRSPVITGVEFLTYSAWPVIVGYAAACLSYIVSRFSNKKWAGMIILVIAVLFYLYVHLVFGVVGIRYDPPSFPLGRGHHIEAEEIFPAMIGIWVNWIGLIFLTVGLYLAERGRGRTAVSFAAIGAALGFGLLIGSLYFGLLALEMLRLLDFQPISRSTYMMLGWLQVFCLPVGGAILGVWLALKKRLPRDE